MKTLGFETWHLQCTAAHLHFPISEQNYCTVFVRQMRQHTVGAFDKGFLSTAILRLKKNSEHTAANTALYSTAEQLMTYYLNHNMAKGNIQTAEVKEGKNV